MNIKKIIEEELNKVLKEAEEPIEKVKERIDNSSVNSPVDIQTIEKYMQATNQNPSERANKVFFVRANVPGLPGYAQIGRAHV